MAEHMTLDDAAEFLRLYAGELWDKGDRAGAGQVLAAAAVCRNVGLHAADKELARRLRPRNGQHHPTQEARWCASQQDWLPTS